MKLRLLLLQKIMRFIGIIITIVISASQFLLAENSMGQVLETRVQLHYTETDLYELIVGIQRKTGIAFAFTDQLGLDKIKVHNVSFENSRLGDVLQDLLPGHAIDFEEISGTIKLQRLQTPGKISGHVSDKQGQPIVGASIRIIELNRSIVSDASGNFSTSARAGTYTLDVSYVSYKAQRSSGIVVNQGQTISLSFVLEEEIGELEDVVVVGYGSQLKKQITGAVQTVSGADLSDMPVSQVAQKLQGWLSGVQINQATGKPGEGMSVRIRGQLSVSGGSQPLYVVDGFPLNGDINSLNPDEIQDISVLKDAASTSMYGSRAANGVVLITTKRGGKVGESNVSVNVFNGFQNVPQHGRIQMMNAEEFVTFKKEIYEDAGKPVPEIFQNPADYKGKTNDWFNALLRTAPIASYNVTITSNKEKSETAIIAGFFDQNGVVLNSDYKRFSLRMNSDYDVSDKVKVGFSLAPNYEIDNTPQTDGGKGTGILFNALHVWPIMPIYDENGELTKSNTLPAETGNIYTYPNYVRSALEITNETKRLNLLTNGYLQYRPIKDLVLKSTINVALGNSNYFFFNPSTATNQINVGIPTVAVSIRQNAEELTWLNENLATYTKDIRDHHFELLGGLTFQHYRRDGTTIRADTYADDRIPTVQGALNINRSGTNSNVDEWSLMSLLSRLTYNYKGKYLLSAAIRKDGSSRFGPNNRWAAFPSASAGWILSDEHFLSNNRRISFAKIRASYGVTGNNNIGNYSQYALVSNTVKAVFDDKVEQGAAINSLANNDLGWETTTQFDAGLDLGLFNNRIQFVYDFYTKNTTNLLYSVQVPQESGFGNFNDNIGEIRFWGHEFALNTINIDRKLRWTSSANISFNRNRVIALAGDVDRVYGTYHITKVGQPFGMFYGVVAEGEYRNEEDLRNSPQVPGRSAVGSIKIKDINHDGVISNGGDNDDRTIIGNPFPKFTYGIVNNIKYGRFDMNIVGSGSYGNQMLVRHLISLANLDGAFNVIKDVKYRFRSEENPGKGRFGTTNGGGNITAIERDWVTSNFIEDASFFTIKNITLGYTLGHIGKFVRTARLYGSVQNVYVFTGYKGGPNPETSTSNDGNSDGGNLSQGVDLSSYPVPRTVTIGANLTF